MNIIAVRPCIRDLIASRYLHAVVIPRYGRRGFDVGLHVLGCRVDILGTWPTWWSDRRYKSLRTSWSLAGGNPLQHRGLEPESVLHLAFQSDALLTELSASLYGLTWLF